MSCLHVALLMLAVGPALAQPLLDEGPAERFFLDNIFNKYGNNGVITFEGFEHLMENLGLGNLRFEHTVMVHRRPGGQFEEVHHSLNLHSHNHTSANTTGTTDRRKRAIPQSTPPSEECLSPERMLSAYGLGADHDVAISPAGFHHICPAIVYQLDEKVCTRPTALPHPSHLNNVTLEAEEAVVWLYASLSILVISVCGLIGVSVVPLLADRPLFGSLLTALSALALGTLTGDALLHLLPHLIAIFSGAVGVITRSRTLKMAISRSRFGPTNSQQEFTAFASAEGDHTLTLLKSSVAFLTLLLFFLLEASIHKNGHTHGVKKNTGPTDEYSMVPIGLTDEVDKVEKRGGKTVGRLVAIGDGLHNFTDGLAIGAAFRADLASGLATALAVLTHELPHELGDFAVLLKTGTSVRRAICYNVLSSVISYLGMAIGIYLGHLNGASHWIYSVTAGSFLYIGLADLVPELHKHRKDCEGGVAATMIQLAGAFTGGALMFLIALYEHDIYEMFQH